jgi:prepilin-type N-terminal cleavage/methylation domain-containing protein
VQVVRAKKRKRNLQDNTGFTLIEILIVVLLLGILATIMIDQLSTSTAEVRLNMLKTNLGNLRGAVRHYYFQHNAVYPGSHSHLDGTGVSSDAEAEAAFLSQLVHYSAANGRTALSGSSEYPYGPYIKDAALPPNPFNHKENLVCDYDQVDITQRDSGGADAGWKFYPRTGVLIAADGEHDTD